MHPTNNPLSKLIFELSKLPGIGEKTATRLSYFILKQNDAYVRSLSEALVNAKVKMQTCQSCFTFTETNPCQTCTDATRNTQSICVVEQPSDVLSIELCGAYRGIYHVLHGVLSPLDGIGPDEIKLYELLNRIELSSQSLAPIREVILAMNPSVEGEATAMYLSKLLKPLGLRLTKLARGIPMGGLLEYTDRQTIGKAFENRLEIT